MATKLCPYCRETIQETALKCRFCHEWLSENATPAQSIIEPVIQNLEPTVQELEPVMEDIKPIVQEAEPAVQDVEPTVQNIETVTQDAEPAVRNVEPEPVIEEAPVAEKIITVPPPIASQVEEAVSRKRMPVFVEEEHLPLVVRQNYKLAKLVSLSIPFAMLLITIGVYSLDADNYSTFEGWSMLFLVSLTVGLTVWLLYMLNKHLLNFDLYNNIRGNISCLIYGMPTCFLIFMFILGELVSIDSTILIIIVLILYAVLLVTHVLTGWRLARFEGDYVGGISAFGYALFLLMILSPFFIPFVVPFFAYNIFKKAEIYAETYGYEEGEDY
ncbi:hypothetical protein [Dysgonomonas sp. ZJ709]|uniref:hypothetical protein n=1 Tax=Dysgonomonas sp. ZJ709 TaxID=2709797 RepID=UPI0013EC822D|nr:hypothetical protein [Dysgonomonas sp. ZJ709]